MVIAFVAIDGRSVSTHAALLAAYGLGLAARSPTTLVRITAGGEAALSISGTMPDAIRVVEHPITDAGPDQAIDTILAAAQQEGRSVLLDIPTICLTDRYRHPRTRLLPIVPVGPTSLDERLAAAALKDLIGGVDLASGPVKSESSGPDSKCQFAPPWLLGCGRSGGGPAVVDFTEAMRTTLAAHTARGAAMLVRVLPMTLPLLSRGEASSLLVGQPKPWLLRSGLLLAAALRAATMAPDAPGIDPAAFAASLGADDPTWITADQRDEAERLRGLADSLQAIRDGHLPTPEELATAPVLDNWAWTTRPVRILEGQSYGHPSIPSGRLVRTSEVYATDGQTFARTFSRLYRLGTPAQDEAAATSLH